MIFYPKRWIRSGVVVKNFENGENFPGEVAEPSWDTGGTLLRVPQYPWGENLETQVLNWRNPYEGTAGSADAEKRGSPIF